MRDTTNQTEEEFQLKEKISESVAYGFSKGKGEAKEGLAVSERFFPGIRHKGRMYWGIHHKNRFIPGVPWCGRFIPGLMTRRGFFPGLAMGDGFTLGIIAAGVFMPGIVHGGSFVPGMEREGRFIPGSFNASRQFIPGRFMRGAFECGLMNNKGFSPIAYETFAPAQAKLLLKEDTGLTSVPRTARVGGLPIRGVVCGTFADGLAYLPNGLATTGGVVIGGLGSKDDVTTLDTQQRLGDYGLDIEDPNDLGSLLGTDGIVEKLEKRLDDFLPGSALGETAQSAMGALADAMEDMAEGRNRLIDDLNQGWADYWNGLLNNNAGGMIAGAGSGTKDAANGVAGAIGGAKLGIAIGGLVGGPVGAVLVGFLGTILGGAGAYLGATEGSSVEGKVADWIVGALVWIWHQIAGEDKKKEEKPKEEKKAGTSQPGEDGTGDDRGGLIFNPARPIGPYISRRKTVIEIDHGESGMMPIVDVEKAPVRIIMTDTGAMLIVDYAALRRMIATNPDRRVAVGLNPVTGATILMPGRVSWGQVYEQSKMPWWLEKVGHPIEEGQAAA